MSTYRKAYKVSPIENSERSVIALTDCSSDSSVSRCIKLMPAIKHPSSYAAASASAAAAAAAAPASRSHRTQHHVTVTV